MPTFHPRLTVNARPPLLGPTTSPHSLCLRPATSLPIHDLHAPFVLPRLELRKLSLSRLALFLGPTSNGSPPHSRPRPQVGKPVSGVRVAVEHPSLAPSLRWPPLNPIPPAHSGPTAGYRRGARDGQLSPPRLLCHCSPGRPPQSGQRVPESARLKIRNVNATASPRMPPSIGLAALT